ncbi:hypothetical protein WOLCODRAFT_112763 [Wolfiporia cocos MD-104 SS10]|uniref:CN hydrolase domain-containing protein n=1 Tax=Wolfiporia cocos (strain MD-104) TaxID=742152 RepID=A0A2H3IVZ5_WOLCO|nr:hypothetical protein WOLCODRAFT_112763 [Wolfiporia cocos MD-104 SS10]
MAQVSGLVVRQPSIYLVVAPLVALTALSTTPSLGGVALLLGVLQLHAHTFLPRGKALSHGVGQVLLLSLASAITHLKPSLNALSSPSISVIVLACLSALSAAISLISISAAYYANRAVATPWAKLTLFPAVWTTVWGAAAYISPVGRLVTWSPIIGLGPYGWIRPVFGQWGVDWITAAWAVVVAETVGGWLVGAAEAEFEDAPAATAHENLVSYGTEDLTQTNGPPPERPRSRTASVPQPRHVFSLAGLLVALTVPSYFFTSLPSPTLSSPDITSLNVACALPQPMRSGEITHAPTLADYTHETSTLNPVADIILWPEGAVRFDRPGEKEEAFKDIMDKMPSKKLYGISFEEYTLEGPSNRRNTPGIRRNGFALLNKEGIVMEYYKRMLVPIAESFALTAYSDPPSVYTWEVGMPKDWAKTKWSSNPNHTRPIPITASICLDFSSSFSFSALDTRPALILAPARTWHISVGYAMWEQARARAEELGSMVLWCDGGDGGVSGVAGAGMHDVVQVGRGSWVKRIGVAYPPDQDRTVYSWGGGWAALVAAWGLAGVGGAAEAGLLMLGRSGDVRVLRGIRSIGEKVMNRLRIRREEERPLLE